MSYIGNNQPQAVVALGGLVPAGTTINFAGASSPQGYLVCDGSEISKTTYDTLYDAIGDLWNTTGGVAAPSAGNFRLPPSEIGGLGLYTRGEGATSVGDYQVDVFKIHDHSIQMHLGSSAMNHTSAAHVAGVDAYTGDEASPINNTGDTTETRPRTITMLMCIKY